MFTGIGIVFKMAWLDEINECMRALTVSEKGGGSGEDLQDLLKMSIISLGSNIIDITFNIAQQLHALR